MGGTTSTPIRRSDLLAATEKPRAFVDVMFQKLFNELLPGDILDLADPRVCNKYVFVMADALKKTFYSLKLVPRRDAKTGLLYYRKKDDLTTKESQESYNDCLALSFFYIRIFQIFGALALTVIDDPNAGYVLGSFAPGAKRPGSNLNVRGSRPVLFGGEIFGTDPYNSRFQNFPWLRKFVTEYEIQPSGVVEFFSDQFDKKIVVSYSINPPKEDSQGKPIYPTEITILVRHPEIHAAIQAAIKSQTKEIQGTSPFIIVNMKLKIPKDEETRNKENEDYVNSILQKVGHTLIATQVGDDWRYIQKDGSSRNLESALLNPFFRAFNLYKDPTSEKDIQELEKYIPKRRTVSYNNTTRNSANRGRETYGYRPSTGTAPETVVDPLKAKFIADTLKRLQSGRPLSHCVGRALQLVDADTLQQMKPSSIKSQICKTRFDGARGGIPEVGKSLKESSPGLQALDILYHTQPFTTVQGATSATPVKFDIRVEDTSDYIQFLTNLRDTFRIAPVAGALDKLSQLKVSEQVACAGKKDKLLEIKDPKVMANLLATIGQLFTIQRNHTLRVVDFMKKRLFQIRTGPQGSTVKLNPALLEGGMPVLNQISKEARTLLTGYYTQCEKTYQLGAQIAAIQGVPMA